MGGFFYALMLKPNTKYNTEYYKIMSKCNIIAILASRKNIFLSISAILSFLLVNF